MTGVVDRRGVIMLGLAAGAGIALPGQAPAQGLPGDERQMLVVLLEAELLTVAAVGQVIASPHLRRRARALARRVLAAEHAHVTALEHALHELGSEARPSAPATVTGIDRALGARHVHQTLSGLRNEHDCLDLLLALESMAEGMYYTAMPNLVRPSLRRLAAGLLAGEAQHEALLGELRNPKDFDRAAPYAFVEGFSP